ncbi:hypothetical protein ACRAWF_30350 [Streptomyces sp. L7]
MAAAGLAAALGAAGPIPSAFSGAASAAARADFDPKPTDGKLGADDAKLLAQAEARGTKSVTMMVATTPGRTEQIAEELDAVKGGSVGRTYDKLGYVRATVPTVRAAEAIEDAAKLSSVQGIDLRKVIPLEEPGSETGKASASAPTYPGPGKDTPAANPYNPSDEVGAVDFVKQHPKADGCGVTIGILDSGVDLASPALQKTTTGERKVVDWVTATDPIIDGDDTWLRMTTSVTGRPSPTRGRTWKAPRVPTGSAYSMSRSPGWAPSRTVTRMATSPRRRHHRRMGRPATTRPPARSPLTQTATATSPTTPR